LGISYVIPYLIEASICFSFDKDLIITSVASDFDELLAFSSGLNNSEQADIHFRLRFLLSAFHCTVKIANFYIYASFLLGLTDYSPVKDGDNDDAEVEIAMTSYVSGFRLNFTFVKYSCSSSGQ